MTQHPADTPQFGTRLETIPSLREQVERTLSSRIVSGQYVPDTVLTVPTLASDFGVSATPVREAMLNLVRRGFLAPVRNRGFRVTEVSADDLRQLVQVRMLLEPPPLADLAGTLQPAIAVQLSGLADEIAAAARESRFEDYLEADTAFHLLLIDQTGNRHLSEIVRDLRQRTRLVGLSKLAASDALVESSLEHRQLVDLLTAGDGDEAVALMRRHIGHVIGLWSGREEDGA